MPRRKTEREPEIMHLWASGWTQKQIGERFGVTQQAITRIIDRLNRESRIKPEDLVAREVAFLDDMRRQAMAIVDSDPAPVTAGKDGDIVRDPESGEIVRDHSGRLAAMREARATSESLRKLVGLDAPTRTKNDNVDIVRYEIVGVESENLE